MGRRSQAPQDVKSRTTLIVLEADRRPFRLRQRRKDLPLLVDEG
jgi:hypothetical protein